ncbi:MAG: hypothetical protein M1820_009411 [Bogoriella megaspora]|nr:MAG: hypothetical protein M1820_009411 [Bogoriella megaspora]
MNGDLLTSRPTKPLESGSFGASRPILLILNTPLPDYETLKPLWENSSFRMCVDGGANKLHDLLPKALRKRHLPSMIHGDLDSLRDDVRTFYSAEKVSITRDGDQYSTDFGKALKTIRSIRSSPNRSSSFFLWNYVIVLGSISGRVDQGIGLLHELLREHVNDTSTKLYLFSESSISYILPPGESAIELDMENGLLTENVGILPIYGPATISTQGLEWDVQDWKTEMGGIVSTSNHIKNEVVRIKTDAHVLFTVERTKETPSIEHEVDGVSGAQ